MRVTQLMACQGTPPPKSIVRKQSGFAALLIVTFVMLFSGRAFAFSQIVAFGDSLTDNGNLFAATGGLAPASPPYFNGRFSNGPVWVETLAGNLGITLDDRAIGGALTDNTNESGFPGLGMADQFSQYFSEGPADPNALYTIWGGANDFLNLGTQDPNVVVGNAVTNLLNGIGGLMGIGAQHFLVVNLPDLGLTPRSLLLPGTGAADATLLSFGFNAVLAGNIGASFPGADIQIMDAFSLLQDVVANPALFGLTNVTDPCLNLTTFIPCATPADYAFWDDIHPTNTLHNQLAAEALLLVAPVPVPAAVWLFGSALGLLGWMRRKAA